MAESLESGSNSNRDGTEIGSEMKKIVNSRAEIDTSPPFGSVKEAIAYFGGRGSWIPLHILRLAAAQGRREFDLSKIEEQASEFENDLIAKQRETIKLLQQLESAKNFVEHLKLNLIKSPRNPSFSSSPVPLPSPGLILMELNQAKLNLGKSATTLSSIHSSLESLNRRIRSNSNTKIFDFEEEQLNFMADGAEYEVMKAKSEIEFAKQSIKLVEMRLIAAKKMEEAARAVEAIVAMAENRSPLPDQYKINISQNTENPLKSTESDAAAMDKFELNQAKSIIRSSVESSELIDMVRRAEELFKKTENPLKLAQKSMENDAATDKFELNQAKLDNLSIVRSSVESSELMDTAKRVENPLKLAQKSIENDSMDKFEVISRKKVVGEKGIDRFFDGNELNNNDLEPVFRSTVSFGDILNTKKERKRVSLSEMLREHNGVMLNSTKNTKDCCGSDNKRSCSNKKRFGFIRVSMPLIKQGKKKSKF